MRLQLNKRLVASLTIMLAATVTMLAARPVVKMSIDSSAVLMGYTVGLNVTVNDAQASQMSQLILRPDSAAAKSNEEGAFLSLTPGVEVVHGYENPALSKSSQAGGGNVLKSVIKIQSFDSGNYIIPPVAYTNGKDTVLSNPVALRVFPVDTVTAESNLMPMSTVMPPYDRKFVDYLPDWLVDNWLWIVIALVIIIGGVCAYLLLTKKVKIKLVPQKKPEPPYDVAVAKLEQLRAEHLCETGYQKEYYTRLSDILREYLDRRFGINAMEMTSTQIRHALNNSRDEILSKELVEHVLEMADFVKFAKARPQGDDNIKVFDYARKFVEDTKPAEQVKNQENDRDSTSGDTQTTS